MGAVHYPHIVGPLFEVFRKFPDADEYARFPRTIYWLKLSEKRHRYWGAQRLRAQQDMQMLLKRPLPPISRQALRLNMWTVNLDCVQHETKSWGKSLRYREALLEAWSANPQYSNLVRDELSAIVLEQRCCAAAVPQHISSNMIVVR